MIAVLVAFITIVFILVGAVYLSAVLSTESLLRLRENIIEWAGFFRIVRYGLWVLLIAQWRQLANVLMRRGLLSEDEYPVFINFRWRVVFWIAVLEVVVIENVVGALLFQH